MTTIESFQGKAFAHRGLWDDGIPENSLTAFRGAEENGFGIELDVQAGKDGVALVFHDETLDRMTGRSGRVEEITLDELGLLRLGQSDEQIPTLEVALSAIHSETPILVEIKTRRDQSIDDRLKFARDVAGLVTASGHAAAIMSFDQDVTHALSIETEILLGQLYPQGQPARETAPDGIDFVGLWHEDVTGSEHLPVFAWTIRSSDDLTNALSERASPIFEGLDTDLVRDLMASISGE